MSKRSLQFQQALDTMDSRRNKKNAKQFVVHVRDDGKPAAYEYGGEIDDWGNSSLDFVEVTEKEGRFATHIREDCAGFVTLKYPPMGK